VAIKKIAISAFHPILFEILEEHLHDAFKIEGIANTDVEIFRLNDTSDNTSSFKNIPKDELPLFVFATYGMGMWSGTEIRTPLNEGAQVIMWARDKEYLNQAREIFPNKNLSLYFVGLPKNPDDTYNKASDHLAQEIAKRIKASYS
jgi:hypothetical protein